MQPAPAAERLHRLGLLPAALAHGGAGIIGLDILNILAATIRDVSFWTGLVTVFAFSRGRFSEKQIDIENIDPPLPAKYFTSRFRYHSSALVFAGLYVILYVGLIVVGSLPMFQGFLKSVFGTLAETGTAAAPPLADSGGSGATYETAGAPADVGTPAWAAMVLMVLAPTIPAVRRAERSFRLWLQEFSDTPYKARGLAEEIIAALLAAHGAPGRLEDAPDAALIAVFDELEGLRGALTASGRNKRDQSYREFFAEQGEILGKAVETFRALAAESETARPSRRNKESAPAAPATRRTQMVILIRRVARLIACALLYAEAEEHGVRERLRALPRLGAIAPATFQFSLAQVVVALVMIVAIAVVSGPLTALICNLAASDFVMTPAQLVQQIQHWAGQGLMIAFAFVLPLFLVAAVRHYQLDLVMHGRGRIPWQERALMLLLTFIGCYGLAVLPILAFLAYEAGRYFNAIHLVLALLWALPPAVINTAFVRLSEVQWRGPQLRAATLDFAVFAGIGGLTAVLASALVTLATIRGHHDFAAYAPLLWGELPFMVTVALVSGFNGALQCGASRIVQTNALQIRRAPGLAVPGLRGALGSPAE